MIDIDRIEKTRWFRYLLRYKLINMREVRNLKIRLDHHALIKEKDFHEAILLLSEKYSLSTDTIRSILYRKERQKDP